MTSLHVKFDSYLELFIKNGERIRHAEGVKCVDLNEISAEILKPKQHEIFGHSQLTKQQLGLSLASSTPEFAQLYVLRSGSVTDEGIVPA